MQLILKYRKWTGALGGECMGMGKDKKVAGNRPLRRQDAKGEEQGEEAETFALLRC
jgi:hypothetical protein